MTSSGFGQWVCNLCGQVHEAPPQAFRRETPSCAGCGSSVRLRALIDLLSTEIFGAHLALPDFPRIKGIRGLGMSDSPRMAAALGEKFDYTNTFYHQEPKFDVVHPEERALGQYDFILSSEVFEHVPPPPERAFANVHRMLKSRGLLLVTVPYTLEARTAEHFPRLHHYALAQVGEKLVLVNRTEDGRLEVFDKLVFHGGHGSTLEMRRFSESALRELLTGAGFRGVRFASEDYPSFGIVHGESWSLPIAARKEPFVLPSTELVEQYRSSLERIRRLEGELAAGRKEFAEYVEFHDRSHAEAGREIAARTQWAQKMEAELAERTEWAQKLEQDLNEHVAIAQRLQREFDERTNWALELDAEAKVTRERLGRLRASWWTRLGRVLGVVR